MFSIIFAIMWVKSLVKAKHVTIDGVYILLPILCDSYVIVEFIGIFK